MGLTGRVVPSIEREAARDRDDVLVGRQVTLPGLGVFRRRSLVAGFEAAVILGPEEGTLGLVRAAQAAKDFQCCGGEAGS